MYISLALLWLCFEIIHGELIIRCLIGGVTDENLCKELITESVMNKFYIQSFNKSINKNPKNRFETLDIPYEKNSNKVRGKGIISKIVQGFNSQFQYYEIFRKSLISNDSASIIERWDEALDIRTDTYMIKFHNQLVHSTRQPSSYEEYMVYIQSYYNAAKILYFYQNYKMAFNVINDGLEYFETIKNTLLTDGTDENHKKNAKMWSILLQALNLDIMNGMTDISDEKKLETKEKISSEVKKFNEASYKSYPISALVYVERIFLYMETSIDESKISQNWLLNDTFRISMENDALYEKYISMNKFLYTFVIHSDSNTMFNNLFKAIQRSVLNIEDRLLNYFAIKSTLKEVKKYIKNNYKDEFKMDKFSIFKDYVQVNNDFFDLQLTTIPKLHILYDMSERLLIDELYQDLTKENTIINENVLHIILSSMLNMNPNSTNYQSTNRKNAEIAITFLNVHIDHHNKLNINEPVTYDYTNVIGKKIHHGVYAYELELIAKTFYDLKIQVTNHFIASKWLIEFNGIFGKKKGGFRNIYSLRFAEIFQKANRLEDIEKQFLKTEEFKNDQHFMFLKAKKMSKVLLPLNDWETYNRPYEWKFEKPKFLCLSDVNQTFMFEQLTKLQVNLNCPYINRIELLTIIFRYHQKYIKDNDAMYSIIKDAISEPVITPEDRMRNLVAHELFSIFLMERNNMAIEKANNLDVNEAYDQFMRDPKLRKKTNSGL